MFFLGNMHYESTILLTSVYGNIICESIRLKREYTRKTLSLL